MLPIPDGTFAAVEDKLLRILPDSRPSEGHPTICRERSEIRSPCTLHWVLYQGPSLLPC